MEHVEKYKIFQKELEGTKDGNPFKDITRDLRRKNSYLFRW